MTELQEVLLVLEKENPDKTSRELLPAALQRIKELKVQKEKDLKSAERAERKARRKQERAEAKRRKHEKKMQYTNHISQGGNIDEKTIE